MATKQDKLTPEEIELGRKAKKLYAKKWREEHKEQVKASYTRSMIRNAIRSGLMDADGNELV